MMAATGMIFDIGQVKKVQVHLHFITKSHQIHATESILTVFSFGKSKNIRESGGFGEGRSEIGNKNIFYYGLKDLSRKLRGLFQTLRSENEIQGLFHISRTSGNPAFKNVLKKSGPSKNTAAKQKDQANLKLWLFETFCGQIEVL